MTGNRRQPLDSQDAAPLRRKVFVGMSGGVDSSVAAALLKNAAPNNFETLFGRLPPERFRGYEVTGVFMKNWADPKYPCPWEEERRDAMRVAAILDIPFQTWDFTKEYREAVVSYMIREYAAGRTPNPDVMCNREIKFGIFLKKAVEMGADFVATGHYVRKQESRSKNQEYELAVAKDLNKDQSYFLWTLTQSQLKYLLFPIGEYTKPEVRELAQKFGLPTAEKPDSQGVCFIGELDVNQFLHDHIPSRTGAVVTSSGKRVGEHDGTEFYTIGQRRGLGLGGRLPEGGEPRPKGAGGIPYYVTEKNTATNTLVVAEGPNDDALFRKELVAQDINWISGEPEFPLTCEARIRYRQTLQACKVTRIATNANANTKGHKMFRVDSCSGDSCNIRVFFKEDQRAVTPGQSIVFYKDGVMLGGGIIT